MSLKTSAWMEYLGVTAGSAIIAAGLAIFLIPNRIAAGGVSGLATVIYYRFGPPVGITMLALNLPLFILAVREMGTRFGLRTLWGTVILSILTDLLAPLIQPPTHDPLLAGIYGGVLVGVGLGIVFRFRGTTGGTDLAAQLLRRHSRFSVGQALMFIDGAVIVLAGFAFNLELALYGLLSLFVTGWVIDLVQEGGGYVKASLIISEQSREIADAILHQLNRGATALRGRGAYTGSEREVVLCVLARSELAALKELVEKVDPRAFVIVYNVHEVLGEGFKSITEKDL